MPSFEFFDDIDFDDFPGVEVESGIFTSVGGPAIVFIRGNNFGGSIVSLEMADGGDKLNRFEPLDNGLFTENGTVKLDYLPQDSKIRARIAQATAALESVYVGIKQ